MKKSYSTYEQVPWNRKSGFNTLLFGLGLFIPPLMWWGVANVLTGEVYENHYHKNGKIKTWSTANKIAGVILFVFLTLGYILAFLQR
jgi:hypothetical protein